MVSESEVHEGGRLCVPNFSENWQEILTALVLCHTFLVHIKIGLRNVKILFNQFVLIKNTMSCSQIVARNPRVNVVFIVI